jgi:Arabidopsis protein of unknown function
MRKTGRNSVSAALFADHSFVSYYFNPSLSSPTRAPLISSSIFYVHIIKNKIQLICTHTQPPLSLYIPHAAIHLPHLQQTGLQITNLDLISQLLNYKQFFKQYSNQPRRKMVPGFSRSHSRTSSLPCLIHPLVSHLEVAIHAARTWLAHSGRDPKPATALYLIDELVLTLEQVLNLPESRESFYSAECTDQLLDDLLCLADVYGSVRSVAILLKQNHVELQSALRRHDATWLVTSVKTQRQIEKEICQLVATVRNVSSGGGTSDIEMGTNVREAVTVAALVSVEALSKVISTSSSAAAASSAMVAMGLSRVSLFKRKCSDEEKEAVAVDRLEALEECVMDLESSSERVFRSLVRARVSLLNVASLSF